MKSLQIKQVKVEDIKFTKDNARKITEESLKDLAVSIEKLGIIRPLILNDKMELMSGNQRTKTMKKLGVETAPAVIIPEVAKSDYINFTLLVNSIEHNKSEVVIHNIEDIPMHEFVSVSTKSIETLEFRNPVVRRDIARSIIKHGQWGSVIINEQGKVIFNSDYASVMETIGYPVTVYKVTKEQEDFINDYFFREYGIYSYDHLNYPSYAQTYVQPKRAVSTGGSGNNMRSLLYDEIARATFESGKDLRYIDFGAGKKVYPEYWQSQGYNFDTYEPFYKIVADNRQGTTYFDLDVILADIKTITENIKNNGLYDVVMCDSVLNATMSKKLELYVISTCASLLKDDGVAYFSSRSLKRLKQVSGANPNSRVALDDTKRTFELDENGMYLSYRKGLYTGQKYHDTLDLRDTLLGYFEEVENKKAKDTSATGIFYECRKPKKIDAEFLREALNEEFNMEYPDGYRHNQHHELVELIMQENNKR